MIYHSTNLTERIIESIPNPIFYKDLKGIYIGCNEAFCLFLKKPRSEILGKTVYEVAPPDLAAIYEKADRELIQNRGIQIYESKVQSSDNVTRDVIFNKSIFCDQDGKPAGIVGVIIDVSEIHNLRKQSAEERLELQKKRFEELSQLSREIAHDIKSPLTAIKIAMSTMEGNLKQKDLLQGTLNRIEFMLKDLEFKKTNYERLKNENLLQEVNLAESLSEAFEVKKMEKANLKNLMLTLEISNEVKSKTPRIHVETHRFMRILSNLLNNAIEALEGKSGEVQLKAEMKPKMVVVSILDTGKGIPPHILPFIGQFESTFGKEGGSGIGLYASKRDISDWNGEFSIESREGKGTLVSFSLPIV